MADTSVTYERTMKVTYPREGGRLSSKLIRKLQQMLTTFGIYMVYRCGWGEPDYSSYEEIEKTETKRSYKLTSDDSDYEIVDFGVVDSNYERSGMKKIVNALNDYASSVIGLSLDETVVTTSTMELPRWKGDAIWINGLEEPQVRMNRDYSGSRMTWTDETDETDMTKMEVLLDPSTSNDSAILTFKIWKEATKTQNKKDIETWLVDTPLDLMGEIQAHIETCLSDVGFDITEPVIDCHFDAKTESRSECAPDIIGRLRDAKQRTIDNQ